MVALSVSVAAAEAEAAGLPVLLALPQALMQPLALENALAVPDTQTERVRAPVPVPLAVPLIVRGLLGLAETEISADAEGEEEAQGESEAVPVPAAPPLFEGAAVPVPLKTALALCVPQAELHPLALLLADPVSVAEELLLRRELVLALPEALTDAQAVKDARVCVALPEAHMLPLRVPVADGETAEELQSEALEEGQREGGALSVCCDGVPERVGGASLWEG